MNKALLLTLFSLIAASCSFFIDSYDENFTRNEKIKPLDQTSVTYCKKPSSRIYLNDNKESQIMFSLFMKNLEKKRVLSYIDKVVLWSFVQMNIRPDLSSPSAKLQVLLNLDNKEYYFNSYALREESYPYLNLLSHLLKKFKSQYSLKELAVIYEREIPRRMKVSKSLASFLREHQADLAKVPLFKKSYIRGDETLKEKEGLPFLRIKNLVNLYNKSKKRARYKISSDLFSRFGQETNFVPKCNFDMNLYKDSLFLISKEKIQAHTFGMKEQKNTFMGVSSQKIQTFKPLDQTISFSGNSNVRSASLCSYSTKSNPQQRLWLISSNSRDPGQHLYHMQEYELSKISNLYELDAMLRFSRHLFLKNPVRLVIESRRSQKSQVQELLKLDIPLYNAKNLGSIWGYFSKNSLKSNSVSFLSDSRTQGAPLCVRN